MLDVRAGRESAMLTGDVKYRGGSMVGCAPADSGEGEVFEETKLCF